MDPKRRASLRVEWALREQAAEREVMRQETPEERVELALELSELAREIGRAAGAAWLASGDDLEDKARRLARPLALSARISR